MVKWKVAAYVRLSSDDGDKSESNSITNQKSIINLYLKNKKDLKLKDFYIDDGYTGTDFDRPGFQRLLNDMKNEKINTVIVKDLSRLGRNYIEVGNYLEQIFPLYNIRFIAINDNIDSVENPNSTNSVIVPFKNLMNDEYARDISNKIRSVLDAKKVSGEFIGSFAPYGYMKDPKNKHKLIIDKTASKVVKKIFKMILNGKSRQDIIDDLNKCGIEPPRLYQIQNSDYKFEITDDMKIWNKKKLDTILTNQSYTGALVQNKKRVISHKIHKMVNNNCDDWIVIPNHHEAIISNEVFYQVQDIIYNRDTRVKNNNEYDIFSGHLRCNDCENSLTLKKGSSQEYYYCTSYLRKKQCFKHSISKKKLEETILNSIRLQISLIIDIDSKIDMITKDNKVNYDLEILNHRISELQMKIEKYEKLKDSLKDDLLCKYITREEYVNYEKEYSEIIKDYKLKISNAQNNIEKISFKSERNKNWIDKFKAMNGLETLTKTVIDELVEDIYLYKDGEVRIIYKYEDEYIEAIDFLNKHKYGIITPEYNAC